MKNVSSSGFVIHEKCCPAEKILSPGFVLHEKCLAVVQKNLAIEKYVCLKLGYNYRTVVFTEKRSLLVTDVLVYVRGRAMESERFLIGLSLSETRLE